MATTNRAEQIRRDNDNVNDLYVGFRDHDYAIKYYLEHMVKPYIVVDKKRIPVPIHMATPERWKSIRSNGYLRDKDQKIINPIIVFRRTGMNKQRDFLMKMDANHPRIYQQVVKQYTMNNSYDHFSAVNNIKPKHEIYNIVIPDYYEFSYSIMIWTYRQTEMNNIIEAISYASDSYWGDPDSYMFLTKIDSITPSNDLSDGEDRIIMSELDLQVQGYLIPASIQQQLTELKKAYTLNKILFDMKTNESTADIQEITDKFKKNNNTNSDFWKDLNSEWFTETNNG